MKFRHISEGACYLSRTLYHTAFLTTPWCGGATSHPPLDTDVSCMRHAGQQKWAWLGEVGTSSSALFSFLLQLKRRGRL